MFFYNNIDFYFAIFYTSVIIKTILKYIKTVIIIYDKNCIH